MTALMVGTVMKRDRVRAAREIAGGPRCRCWCGTPGVPGLGRRLFHLVSWLTAAALTPLMRRWRPRRLVAYLPFAAAANLRRRPRPAGAGRSGRSIGGQHRRRHASRSLPGADAEPRAARRQYQLNAWNAQRRRVSTTFAEQDRRRAPARPAPAPAPGECGAPNPEAGRALLLASGPNGGSPPAMATTSGSISTACPPGASSPAIVCSADCQRCSSVMCNSTLHRRDDVERTRERRRRPAPMSTCAKALPRENRRRRPVHGRLGQIDGR